MPKTTDSPTDGAGAPRSRAEAASQPPGRRGQPGWDAVEQHASRIEDPIERLRFLRKHAPPTVAASEPVPEPEISPRAADAPPLLPEPAPAPSQHKAGLKKAWWVLGVLATALGSSAAVIAHLEATAQPPRAISRSFSARKPKVLPPTVDDSPEVWLVDHSSQAEIYSNGLRVEVLGSLRYLPRRYPMFSLSSPDAGPNWRTAPMGILFHGTENDPAPMTPAEASRIRRKSRGLIDHVREHRAYHYVVDRVGRVTQVIDPNSKADHAGNSVWSNGEDLLLQLNASFLGVAFEAQTQGEAAEPALTAAQMHAGRLLTDMLRSRFHISAKNCLTHAQVSVNPKLFMHGFHSDWSRGFPWEALGLPNNYVQTPASIRSFGFAFDHAFLDAADPSLKAALGKDMDSLVGRFGVFRPTPEMEKGRKRYLALSERAAKLLREDQ